MKKIFAVVFLCTATILGICVILTFIKKKKIAKFLRFPLLFALLPAIANFILMICTTHKESNLAYGIFYGSINWLLISLLQFCVVYTNLKPAPKFINYILLFLTAADSISMFLNPIFGHAFVCTQTIGKDGNFYFIATGLIWFKVHLVLSYILSLLCFSLLIYKLKTTAKVYWEKYIVIICVMAIALIWDAFFVLDTDEIDKSIIGYAIGFLLLTYYTLIYKSGPLINSLLKDAVYHSSDMMIFFNIDNECVFANDATKKFFNVTDSNLEKLIPSLKLILKNDFLPSDKNEYRKVFTVNFNGEKKHLNIEFNRVQTRNKPEGFSYHIQDITKEINQVEEDRYKATHNDLTGLNNRISLIEKTENLLKDNPEKQYYVIATDIKNLRLINNLFGREIGDRVILHIAKLLSAPSMPNEIIGQLSGDHFIQIVNELNLEENISQLSKSYGTTLDLLKDKHYSTIVHSGIYKISPKDISVMAMFDRAFLAISSIKETYENQLAYYDESMLKSIIWEQKIISEVDGALQSRQFEVYLQPQTDKDCNIAGAEALVRWNHPEKGLLPPNQFIKTFEKNGLISKLDLYMWERAFQLLAKWKRLGKRDFYISVNLSPLDFYYLDVYSTFMELSKKYEVEPRNIHIEITETIMLTDQELKLPVIERLHLAGFIFVMDDFGAGYSSLNMLKDFPVDVLKMDMGFLYRSKDVSRSKIIIKQLSDLAKQLGLTVATEGLETQTQLDFLKETGCDSYQGYYFTTPIPVKDFEQKYFTVS